MDTLEQARAEIDAVDAQLAALFERRMAAVLSVAGGGGAGKGCGPHPERCPPALL